MSVKLILSVSANSESNLDFKFEIDDCQQTGELERNIVENMAAACLVELQRISSNTGGVVIEE